PRCGSGSLVMGPGWRTMLDRELPAVLAETGEDGPSRRSRRSSPCSADLDEPLEDGRVDVGQPLDVEAPLAAGVLPDAFEQRVRFLRAQEAVERQVLLARGETDREPVELAAAGVLEMAGAEADDARSPHL